MNFDYLHCSDRFDRRPSRDSVGDQIGQENFEKVASAESEGSELLSMIDER